MYLRLRIKEQGVRQSGRHIGAGCDLPGLGAAAPPSGRAALSALPPPLLPPPTAPRVCTLAPAQPDLRRRRRHRCCFQSLMRYRYRYRSTQLHAGGTGVMKVCFMAHDNVQELSMPRLEHALAKAAGCTMAMENGPQLTIRAEYALLGGPIGAMRLTTLGLVQHHRRSGGSAAKGWDAAETAKRQALGLHPVAQKLPQAGDQRR